MDSGLAELHHLTTPLRPWESHQAPRRLSAPTKPAMASWLLSTPRPIRALRAAIQPLPPRSGPAQAGSLFRVAAQVHVKVQNEGSLRVPPEFTDAAGGPHVSIRPGGHERGRATLTAPWVAARGGPVRGWYLVVLISGPKSVRTS